MAPQAVKKWSHEATKTLVALYELQPTLYKTTSPTYHNKAMRFKALDSICNELNNVFKLNFSVEEVSKKINNLRTQFLEVNRACNKTNLPSGSGGDNIQLPTWWLYDTLQFLLPYCKKDKGISNLRESSVLQQEVAQPLDLPNNEENEETILEVNTEVLEGDYEISEEGVLSPAASVASSSSFCSQKKTQTSKTPTKKRKRTNNNVDDAITNAIEKLSEEKPMFPSHIESFCNFIGHELSSLNSKPQLQQCKWEILKIIQDFQEKEVSDYDN